jgi:hypothetical protein
MVPALPNAPAEERISLPKLAHERGVSPVSTWRWSVRGYRGIILPTFCVGRKRYTTRSAFSEWCAAVTLAAAAAPSESVAKGREAAIQRAEREAAQLGCP